MLSLGLEEVYKHMAEKHKFHIDVVREVAAGQQCLEDADQVLCRMRKAAQCEYEWITKQEFGVALQTEESSGAEEEEDVASLGNGEHTCLAPDL